MMASDAGCVLEGFELDYHVDKLRLVSTVVTLSVRVSVSIRNDKLFTVP